MFVVLMGLILFMLGVSKCLRLDLWEIELDFPQTFSYYGRIDTEHLLWPKYFGVSINIEDRNVRTLGEIKVLRHFYLFKIVVCILL